MKFNEIDWQLPYTRRILETLSDGLKDVLQDLDEAKETPDSTFTDDVALEHADNLFGIVFVTVQAYITSTISDASRLVKNNVKPTKEQLLKDFNPKLPNLSVTKLELCDVTANYYKHHDEWPDWSPTGFNRKTIATLNTVGITKQDYFVCLKVADLLDLNDPDLDLEPLLVLLSSWRKSVIDYYSN